MTAADLAALDPGAAAYIRAIARPVTALLAAHGDTDPSATLALLQRAVATHLAPIGV